jgi:CSLREA domain-containing protein
MRIIGSTSRFIAIAVMLVVFPGQAAAVEFPVNSAVDATDVDPGDGICSVDGTPGYCSLRAAIQETNHLAGPDRITIPAGTWVLSLTGAGEDGATTGDLDVTDDLEIVGVGSTLVTIDGNHLDRVLHLINTNAMFPAPSIALRGITVTSGEATTPAAGYLGGGIFAESFSSLDMTDVRIVGNFANQGGGVHILGGVVTIDQCSFLDNTTLDIGFTNPDGGALYASSSAIDITASTFSDNNGGIVGRQVASFRGCDPARIITSTMAENNGTAIRSWNSNTEIIQSTIVTGDGIQGISFGSFDGTNTLLMAGSVVTGYPAYNCSITSGIYTHSANVESGDSCDLDTSAGELINTDPILGALRDNGGPTETFEPRPRSPLIDLMSAVDPYCQWEDQRGVRRPLDGNWDGTAGCDVGAVESTLLFADDFESGFTDAWSGTL